jgi:hypothetical protein
MTFVTPESIETRRWAQALRGTFTEIVRFLRDYVDDAAGTEAALVRALADVSLATGVGRAVLALPSASRTRLVRLVAEDPRGSVRAAVFAEWAPVLAIPRRGPGLVPEPEWTELLRRALCDDQPRVRAAACALAFDTNRGGELVPELLRMLEGDEGADELRWHAVLALGGARDDISGQRLRGLVMTARPSLAAAAIRALALRPDGGVDVMAVLDDARPEVQQAAIFAIEHLVEHLETSDLALLEGPEAPGSMRVAALAYRARRAVDR